MKKTATNEIINETTITTINPFEDLSAGVKATVGRKLAYTDLLNSIAAERAGDAIMVASKTPELYSVANAMMDSGDPADLIALFEATGELDHVEKDAEQLDGCDAETLKRMLESRRSDRSKNKKKGVRSSIVVCKAYVAAFYAELVIRQAMDKPYTGRAGVTAAALDTDDVEAVNRRIKSLQSKKCRLNKLAAIGDVEAQKELDETIAEIERLRAFRPATSTTTTVKSVKVDELRAALAQLNPNEVPEEVRALLAKIG